MGELIAKPWIVKASPTLSSLDFRLRERWLASSESSWYVYIVGMLRYRELESGVKASHPLIPEYYKKKKKIYVVALGAKRITSTW